MDQEQYLQNYQHVFSCVLISIVDRTLIPFKQNISTPTFIKSQSHKMPPYSQMVSSASQQLLYYLQHLSLHWQGRVESDILLHRPLQISQINKTSSQQSSHSEQESLH